jgi:ribonucleoside-diphosphate reductase alpha subunit
MEREMYVLKRNGRREVMSFDKILHRMKLLGNKGQDVNYTSLTMKVIEKLYDGISTAVIDELSAEQCASISSMHPDYGILASRLLVSNHHKNTSASFSKTMKGVSSTLSKSFMDLVTTHKKIIDEICDYSRDYLIDYFGFKTLLKSYLLNSNGFVERPQHMWLRIALAIHADDFEKVKETYYYLSMKYFTHATPTLYNAGTAVPQLSSCYLLAMESDSIEGIFNTVKDCALISKWGGGIGLHIHNVRASGSKINSTNGISSGIVPMLRVYNNTAKYVDQGGGRRNGSFAIYIEPWHADVLAFLQLRKNHGDEELKARDLFTALWLPDLFMKRVHESKEWTLMCPNECPGLSDVYGEDFVTLYESYERNGKGRSKINARDLWFEILDAQMETGTPYLLYKDTCNKKSNQKNVGTIKSSNLCTEILLYSDEKETAVCNLASIALSACVKVNNDNTFSFDYETLATLTKIVVRNLNIVIDKTYYPTEKCRTSNLRHRPLGIGIQGLADVFLLMNLPFVCEESKIINKNIFETIYFSSLEESCRMAQEYGHYETFPGSPASEGILQFDMWNYCQDDSRHNWTELKQNIIKHGLRNSVLLAPMPTSSTSQILGNNECIEPITSNIYSRRTQAGEFVITNKYLVKDLLLLGMWNEKMKNNIIANKGSIQHISDIPLTIRNKYKTVWEISMKSIIDMAVDRGRYICQSQSLNLWLEEPTYSSLTSMHFYSWSQGLKTGIYYLRRRAKYQTQQFTIEPETDTCPSCSA